MGVCQARAGAASYGSNVIGMMSALVALTVPLSIEAHPGAHEQEKAADRVLVRNPRDAGAHIARGKLHHDAKEWDQALARYERARFLGAPAEEVSILEGETYLALKWPHMAKRRFDAALEVASTSPRARIGRARAWRALGDLVEAENDYEVAFAHLGRAQPALVLERHEVLLAAGRSAHALQILDTMMARMGAVPALQLAAVDLDLVERRYDAALGRIDRLLQRSPTHPLWAARRAEILAAADREQEARAAYEHAVALIETRIAQRPSRRLETLNRELRAVLARSDGERLEGQ